MKKNFVGTRPNQHTAPAGNRRIIVSSGPVRAVVSTLVITDHLPASILIWVLFLF